MKVFTSIFKRIYRRLSDEFRLLYKLNKEYVDPEKYVDILDNPASAQDYQGSENDVVPAADPQAQTDSMKQQKAQAILQAVQMGGLDPQKAMMRFLEANSVEDIQSLMPDQQAAPPPPPPEVQKLQMEMQFKQKEFEMKQQLMGMELQIKQQSVQLEQQLADIKLRTAEMELALEEARMKLEAQQSGMDLQLKSSEHGMKLQQGQEKMALDKLKQNAKLASDLRMQAHKEAIATKESTNHASNKG
jgi:hypothetical protein